MFKKALIAGAIIAATSGLAFANGGSFTPPPPHCVGAWYLGIAGSRDAGHFRTGDHVLTTHYLQNFGVNGNTFTDLGNSEYNHSFDWSAHGWDGEVFGGYQWLIKNRFSVAIEANANWSTLKGNYRISDATYGNGVEYPAGVQTGGASAHARIEMNNTLGISLLPGVKISPSTTLYGRVGYVYSEFELTDTNNNSFLSGNPGTAFSGGAVDVKHDEGGIILGIGMEAMVTKHIGIRTEYDWSHYGKFRYSNFLGTSNTAVPNNFNQSIVSTSHGTVTVRPNSIDQIKVGIDYHFNAMA